MTDRPHEAALVFAYDSERRAELVERAVAREVGEIEGDRTAASLSRSGPEVEVRVVADDLTALRAGLNTWTGLVRVAEDVAGAA